MKLAELNLEALKPAKVTTVDMDAVIGYGRRVAAPAGTMGRQRATRRVVTRERVIERARQYFLDHATIDMDDLARELSVSRATLYRVAHSRDQLLGDVLWYFAEHLFDIVRKERDLTGVEGVLQVTRLFNQRLARADRLRRFLEAEPHCAARVLFTPAGDVLRRHVVVQRAIFAEAAPPEGPWLTGDLDHLAYLYACTIATGFYAEILAGLKPDTEQTERVTRALLTQALG
jgi:AcrR family transcriptional regulator